MIEAGDVTFRAAPTDRRLRAHLARPSPGPGADPAPGPAVIVIHEALGLNDDTRRIAATFAEHGYGALAPDLVGEGFKPFCIARFFAGIGRTGTGRPYRETRAFHDWLAARPWVDPDRIGMAGFCAGGGFVMLYAARGDRPLRAIAPFYGDLPSDRSMIADLCPTVASYGGRDAMFGRLGDELEEALDAAGIPKDVRTYPEAGHSFMSEHRGLLGRIGPYTPMHAAFDPRAAEDAWSRVLDFFERHLAPSA